MKKIAVILVSLLLPFVMMAQLPYDTEMTKSHYQDPKVIIASEGTVEWSSISLGKLDYTGIYLGETVLFGDAKTHAVQIALPTIGLPDELSFSYVSITANHGTWTVYESSNHSDWSLVRSGSIEAAVTKYGESAKLKSSTRYLKFEYVGKAHILFNAIKVAEKKELSVSTDEFLFPTAKVDATASTKSVKINWTNVTGTISSTNPAFTLSRSTFGEKNKENQSTDVVISYSHENYGTHEGLIVFEAEGLRDTVKVSGTTERYAQTLMWNQTLKTLKTTDKVMLQAYTSLSQPVSYTTSNIQVAEVDTNNFLVVKCAGTVDITAFHPGDRKYEPTNQITKTVTIVKVDPVVSVSASEITYGQSLRNVELTEYVGEASGSLEFRNINLDTILNANIYNLQVAFVPEDGCIYNEVLRQVQVQVNKASQTITWNQSVTTLRVADTIMLTAYASSHLPLTYAYTNCNVHIEDNQMVGVEAGNVQVIAFQDGDKNYLPSTVAKQSFEVIENPNYTPYVPVIHDTVVVRDTMIVRDTVLVPDTIFISDTVVVYDTVIVYDTPVVTSERMIEADPSVAELEEKGQKYYQNGRLYIYYRRRLYNAEGQLLR